MKTIFLQFTEEATDHEFMVISEQLNDFDPDLKMILLPHNIEPKVLVEPLTKLEEFAKSAMEGMLAFSDDIGNPEDHDFEGTTEELRAICAFDQAEAMLKEAERRQS